jgi:molybdopterin converting factor small subunit
MRVLVEVFATLRERLGWSLKSVEFSCDEVTLEDLLKSVKDLHDLLINDFRW